MTPPLTSLITMAPVPAKTSANAPRNSAKHFLRITVRGFQKHICLSICTVGLVFTCVKTHMFSMRELAKIFAALADPTRLRLLHLMKADEVCVCFLQGVLQTNQPKISRHL